MRPEQVLTISSAYVLESGRRYPPLEIRMASDFARDDINTWGVVRGIGLCDVEIPFLRIVGDRNWHSRFNFEQQGGDWHQELWNLCGLFLLGARNVKIGALEVEGIPNIGLYTRGVSGLSLGSLRANRVMNPLFIDYPLYNGLGSYGLDLRNLVTTDCWIDRAQDAANAWRSKTLRHASDDLAGHGGVYVTAINWLLDGYVHQGDGSGWKVNGSYFTIRNYHGRDGYLNGIVPSNLTTFPGEEYRHLHEARGISVEDSVFCDDYASPNSPARLVTISYPFTDPPVFRRCTFVRGDATFATQINYASVVFDDCDFVGWASTAATAELSPPYQGMPAGSASFTNCRVWTS